MGTKMAIRSLARLFVIYDVFSCIYDVLINEPKWDQYFQMSQSETSIFELAKVRPRHKIFLKLYWDQGIRPF